jgi:hypothetical protein
VLAAGAVGDIQAGQQGDVEFGQEPIHAFESDTQPDEATARFEQPFKEGASKTKTDTERDCKSRMQSARLKQSPKDPLPNFSANETAIR